ncbi:mycofactocin biosynthesis peptidyl-dipeptidase MftE [Skermania sp. ID1734]|uniref:mycofactocin biosynthesis peptidyl-dipeptidase MftE n=1 Tax=Skermania sp. ID1734 TaxID=2597516 RepID=UPI00117C820D|nr:mycofactocin biosynthesis peptidyl-dipeptidase MftE [Skermania sp. ID1734]TSE02184.1 mycofactocin biosynthesis peptidyl-dipeptidase MftE [Skermania sp. ID1734]
MSDLAGRVWPEIPSAAYTLAVPVGSLEQHGPHLPLDTDTVIASAVAAALPDTELAPAIAYGSSGEHEGFNGTISIGQAALTNLIVEYGRSAFRWARRAVFVNGHGGNAAALAEAIALLRWEGRDCAWLPCAVADGDAHAGYTETSLMLHLAPDRVRMDRAEVGVTEPIAGLLPRLRASGVGAISRNGVLGDPVRANPTAGAQIFDMLIANARGRLDRWNVGTNGLLS